jgi:hypothetical protein
LAPKGLLIEEQRTNLLLRSGEFDNAAWTRTGVSVTANSTAAPDGTTTADLITVDTSTGAHSVDDNTLWQTGSLGGSFTISIFVKAAGARYFQITYGAVRFGSSQYATFDLDTGTVSGSSTGTASIQSLPNSWFRVAFTAVTTAASGNGEVFFLIENSPTGRANSYTGDGTSGIYIWGAQLEAGAFATSYIPTVASQVTRSADSAIMTGTNFSSWYNASEGTLYAEWVYNGYSSPANMLFAMTDGTTNNVLNGFLSTATNFKFTTVSGNVASVSTDMTVVANTPYKFAGGFKGGTGASSLNGAGALTSSSMLTPANINRLGIGSRLNSLTLNGTIKKLAYYPRRLSNTELQIITS